MVDDIAPQGAKVTLDKERTIYFNMKAIRNMLKEHGSLADVMNFFVSLDGISPSSFTADALDKIGSIIAIGLQHEDPTVTSDFVLDNLDFNNLVPVAQALGYALKDCLPQPKQNP